MARPTIGDITRRSATVDGITLDTKQHVESRLAALLEDAARVAAGVRALRTGFESVTSTDDFEDQFRALQKLRDDNRFTQASAVDMREWRVAAVEQLWRLVLESGVERCCTWTSIPPAWICTADEFEAVRASNLTEQFRSLLNRHGAGNAGGWLIAKLDAEFDLRNHLYRLHLHGTACGDMIKVLDALRGSSVLRPQRTPAIEGRRVARPLQIDRRPLTNLPMPLSYMVKGHFSARWLGYGSDGTVKRGSHPVRIPEPFGTKALLWLDRQRLSEMFVMSNLTVRNRELVKRT